MKSSIARSLFASLAIATLAVTGPTVAPAEDHPRSGPGWIGAFLADDEKGARIHAVIRDAPADKAGLRADDVVTEADGKAVRSPANLTAIVRDTAAGKEIALQVSRGGKTVTAHVKVAEWPQWFGAPDPGGWGFWWRGPERGWRIPPEIQDRAQKELDKLRRELDELRQRFDKFLSDKKGDRI